MYFSEVYKELNVKPIANETRRVRKNPSGQK